ncbi:anti-sigma factor antagonist [Patescibacteria group bacterium]|nr:anti-sigma factor antagonist [Patescibacteria group bacterium]
MKAEVKDFQETSVIILSGRIDASTAPQLEETLIDLMNKGKIQILINFKETDYISSGGLRVLLIVAKELKVRDGNLRLCHLNPNIYKIFKLAGFTVIFDIYETEEEALTLRSEKPSMRIYFWGTRGSLPSSITAEMVRAKIHKAIKEAQKRSLETDEAVVEFINNLPFSVRGSYGCNTSCVQIRGAEEYIICDAGTGLRDLGNYIMKSGKSPGIFHIFMSHLHWDHIQGFPFFTPAYIHSNQINVYGFHHELEEVFTGQQDNPNFPVPLKAMSADIKFKVLELDKEYEIAGFKIKGTKQNHPGDSFGYSFERGGKRIVYSTDAEHKKEAESEGYSFLDFFKNADLLIFDAQYSLSDAIDIKENWGHSSNLVGVELSVKAKVKRLCLFHNEPTCDDERLDRFLNDTREYLKIHAESYPLKIDLAYDGLEIEV